MKLRKLSYIFLAFSLLGVSLVMNAKVKKSTVYMFGFSASFTDSLVYITDIQRLDSAYIDTKTDFLMDRPVYSDQLQTFLEATTGMPDCTCVVFFDTKKSKLSEEYAKIKKRYDQDSTLVVKTLPLGEFYFQSPRYVDNDKNKK